MKVVIQKQNSLNLIPSGFRTLYISAGQEEPARMRELPREFKFNKSEFNIYGLSQLLRGSDQGYEIYWPFFYWPFFIGLCRSYYIPAIELTEKQSTWISRTEIDPHFDITDSFSSILASSKKSTERISNDLREGFKKQRKLFTDREKSRNLESQIIDAKIKVNKYYCIRLILISKAVISSKSKVQAITSECLKNCPKLASTSEILAILQKQKFLD